MAGGDDREAWLRVSLTPGLTRTHFRALLTAFGLPEQILAASPGARSRFVPEPLARDIGKAAAAAVEDALMWCQGSDNGLVTLADPEYPRALLDIPDPPILLYAKGQRALLNTPSFAIVGSRHATPQGTDHAYAFAETLCAAGLTIVSGLALGIDAAAHRGALAATGATIAVVGTGLDVVYPARHRDLAHDIAVSGLLLSEFPLGTPSRPAHFPQRNRIISGLGQGTLVVEAGMASGSLITARLAAEQGKDVFAIPGSIHSPLAKGCHALIKQGAKLVEAASDILEELRWPAPVAATASPDSPDDPRLEPLLTALGHDPCSIDQLSARTGWPAHAVAAALTELEIAGTVASLPGSLYQRRS